jgi:hypothetical protein
MNGRPEAIEAAARNILAGEPGPVVRCRLLREVLERAGDDPELLQAKAGLEASACVRELAREQRPDGGWGAFHSRSTKLKQKIASTEVGVERALALGLDANHPIVQKASRYLLDLLNKKIEFPDYKEKNDRWPTGERMFAASTFSLIHPADPSLDADRALWMEIARRTFRSGAYSEQDEIEAHRELTGATVQGSYLVISSRYQLNILGSIPGMFPDKIEKALLAWLWELPAGIGYLTEPLARPSLGMTGKMDRWLASHEMLARLFPSWTDFAGGIITRLWEQRGADGLWDFGPKPASINTLPLSDTWRPPHRQFDWTTRVLSLLSRFYGK